MFKNLKNPIMPRLRFIREVKPEEVAENYRYKNYSLYSLDWEYKEKEMVRKHEEWVRQCWPNTIIDGIVPKFVPLFPPEFDAEVKGFEFMLSSSYIREIRHETMLGMAEWNRERGFDTMIREECLAGAIANFSTAFTLLADCIAKKENGIYRWGHRLWVWRAMLLYKFWDRETGRGCAAQHSHINEWDDDFWRDRYKGEERDHLESFLLAVKRQYDLCDTAARAITESIPITNVVGSLTGNKKESPKS